MLVQIRWIFDENEMTSTWDFGIYFISQGSEAPAVLPEPLLFTYKNEIQH